MGKSIIEYNIIFKENTELYKEYDGEFISEDKEETDRIFDENKEQIEQYFSKEWIYDDSDYVEGNVEILYNAMQIDKGRIEELYKKIIYILNDDLPNEEFCTDTENDLISDLCNLKESIENYLGKL